MSIYTYYKVIASELKEMQEANQLTDDILKVHRFAGDRTLEEIVTAPADYYDFDVDVFLRDGVPLLYIGRKQTMHMLNSAATRPRSLSAFLATVQDAATGTATDAPKDNFDIHAALNPPQKMQINAPAPIPSMVRQVLIIVQDTVELPPLGVEFTKAEFPNLGPVTLVTINDGTELFPKEFRRIFNKHLGGKRGYVGLYCTTNNVRVIFNEVISFDATVSEYAGRINDAPELWFIAVVRAKHAGRWALGQTISKEESNEIVKVSNNQIYRKTEVTPIQAVDFYSKYAMFADDVLLVAYRKQDTTYYTIETYEVPPRGDMGI